MYFEMEGYILFALEVILQEAEESEKVQTHMERGVGNQVYD